MAELLTYSGTNVDWRAIQPKQMNHPDEMVVFFPGLFMGNDYQAVQKQAQAFANKAGSMTYTMIPQLNTSAIQPQADAVASFIEQLGKDQDKHKTTLVGVSRGGKLATAVANRLPDMEVKGVIQVCTRGLSEESPMKLVMDALFHEPGRYLRTHGPKKSDRESEKAKKKKFIRELASGFRKELRHPKRFMNNVQACAQDNMHDRKNLKAPVVVIAGETDLLADPRKIIFSAEGKGYAEGKEREDMLKELFPESEKAWLIVARHGGTHGLISLRPEAIANASLSLLDRHYASTASTKLSKAS